MNDQEKIKYLEDLLEDFAIEGKRLVDSTLSAEVLSGGCKLKSARKNMQYLISKWENR
jgi:hypothetical protein